MTKPTILIVDDEDYTLNLLKKVLCEKGNLLFATSGEEAIGIFQREVIDLLLLDQRMPGMGGIEVLKRVKSLEPDVVVVMMTGYGTIGEAVEAMRLGAYHYLTKPFHDLDEITVIVDKALEERALLNEVNYLRRQVRETYSFNGIVGKSIGIQKILELVRRIAPTDSTVLLLGESGTGKELIAGIIHQNSLRKDKKFTTVDCASIPETLLESTLFGFQQGAFTGALKTTKGYFEEADGGTLFLDEILETSPRLQASLLRVLQEKEFSRLGNTAKIKTDFRLITATNKDLKKEVERGAFREDLYYRISVIPISIPPLRERREDIPLLINHFLEEFNKRAGKRVWPFTPESLYILEKAEWKGNVRELKNVVERVVAMKDRGEITPQDLSEYLVKEIETFPSPHIYREARGLFEKRYLEEVLERTGGNITLAAKESGIRRQNLYYKLKKYGLDRRK
ncbi:MAG: sigma-54-dependent Fis family transcriptional regulator [Deltaproteobacteria bacterium]|nr:sigma-54-dependent Fis family transcriptional regulator [Deltaproteobacteria bacterium]